MAQKVSLRASGYVALHHGELARAWIHPGGLQLADAEAKLNEIKDRHKDIQQLEKSLLVRAWLLAGSRLSSRG